MKATIIEQFDGVIYYACEGKVYSLKVTDDMCRLSLSEELEHTNDFDYGSPYVKVFNKWVYPLPTELSEDEAAVIAQEHHALAVPVAAEELAEYSLANPKYAFYLSNR